MRSGSSRPRSLSVRDQRRQILLELWQAALAAVDGRECVRRALLDRSLGAGPWRVIAIGKAAAAMALGAVDALGARLSQLLVVTKHGHLGGSLGTLAIPCEAIESAHPIPDESSLRAGARLLETLRAAASGESLLFLISGGASSLVEVLQPGVTLADLQELNDRAQSAGLDIDSLNALRKRLSRIKGGRLAREVGHRTALALMISDVPGDDPAVIGSGLLHADAGESTTIRPAEFCSRLLAALPELPHPDDTPAIPFEIVANAEQAAAGAARAARLRNLPVTVAEKRLQGEAADVGNKLGRRLVKGRRGVWIGAGETTVTLPGNPGRGGRNQHLALAAAIAIEGHADITLLAAGTDGTDGPTDDAGAIVDGETVTRGRIDGLDPAECLTRADAGRFLEAAGDLLNTGPTGTNVGDLVIALVTRTTIDG